MSDNLAGAKDSLAETLESIKDLPDLSEEVKEDLHFRLQAAYNALIQNERKIWLRTKLGKELTSGFTKASESLLEALGEPGGFNIEKFEARVEDVEAITKRLKDESRRREMVVT